MMRFVPVVTLALGLAACSKAAEESASEPAVEEKKLPPRPEKVGDEPALVTVKHVLVMFKGANPRSTATRSKAEAEKLAYDIIGWAKEGQDFDALMRKYSDDPGPGTYTMVNKGLDANQPSGEYARGDMAKAFGDVGFRIAVDEIGIAMYDPAESPFGYHIIKRVK